ncbi:hypothetical protein HMPREF1232_1155 [Streptococcus pyogenes GA40468]|nr:hypothetical protein HMPREF1232_1155 [Streptococcus pyogenes GA40468]
MVKNSQEKRSYFCKNNLFFGDIKDDPPFIWKLSYVKR